MPGDSIHIQSQRTLFIHTNILKALHKRIILITFLFLAEKIIFILLGFIFKYIKNGLVIKFGFVDMTFAKRMIRLEILDFVAIMFIETKQNILGIK